VRVDDVAALPLTDFCSYPSTYERGYSSACGDLVAIVKCVIPALHAARRTGSSSLA
jgi:hypothetical protein